MSTETTTTTLSTDPGQDSNDNYLLTSARFAKAESRKTVGGELPRKLRVEENPRLGRRGQAVAEAGQRSQGVQADEAFENDLVLFGEGDGALAAVQNGSFWTPGFEKAMEEMKIGGRLDTSVAALARVVADDGSGSLEDATLVDPATPASQVDIREIRSAVEGAVEGAVEEAVEKQVAEALGPLRLITKTLGQAAEKTSRIIEETNRENSDFHEQNDVMSRQIDLHYRDIQQHADLASAQLKALANLVNAHTNLADNLVKVQASQINNLVAAQTSQVNNLVDAQANQLGNLVAAQTTQVNTLADTHTKITQSANDNLAATCQLVSQLSQVVANLSSSIDQTVQNAVDKAVKDSVTKATESALNQVVAAHEKSLEAFEATYRCQHDSFDRYRAAAVQELSERQRGFSAHELDHIRSQEYGNSRRVKGRKFGCIKAVCKKMLCL
ncbi:hypothetical protein CP533_6367 [Ophiocordyceps camponoti-saundersi (nom. inval.)]|nr:hypothetical protein CP533_6367 [Ophiocordyceps camponoti-saundersi (nom. inval.)]